MVTAKEYKLWYDKPAPNRGNIPMNWPAHWASEKDADWEAWSLPLGGGHLGANIFGRTDTERIQITEVSLANPYPWGVNNFAEIFIDINHPENDIQNYTRDLVLNDATAHVQYNYQGTTYRREYLASYPDAVVAVKFSASESGKISFAIRAETLYLIPFGEEGNYGKTGQVTSDGNKITISGEMEYYGISYEGQVCVVTDGGTVLTKDGKIIVESADTATIYIAGGTNYVMTEKTFTESNRLKKLAGNPHPHKRVSDIIGNACKLGYEVLRHNHVTDYCEFFERVSLDLGGKPSSVPTDRMLENYKEGIHDIYLEELYFQFGRYLLISSSRKGTLPGNLQGIWNQYGKSPWSTGYWHNINIQMNYWPAFTTNLAEMFESYADYNRTFRKLAQNAADEYLLQIREENTDVHYAVPMDEAGKNGWAIGTGAWPYTIDRTKPGGHSGPGTSALTAKMFWDCYDYTRDKTILKDTAYPILSDVANFLSKVVMEKDGLLLAHPSASPEQQDRDTGQHYMTTGCAFDQQMIYENHRDTIEAAKILGIDDELVHTVKHQLNKLEPVIVGESGQIKEYREEGAYGEIGDPKHRHISHLKALFPGQLINDHTKEWIEAAKVTLDSRGDKSTGWAMAHRLLLWARARCGDRAHVLLQTLLKVGTLPNLWDTHPPFQIDGNYGGTAGVAEMLLQSNGNIIEPLAALPLSWANGSYSGLVARGNFVIDCKWDNSCITKLMITARVGGICQIRYPGIVGATVTDQKGNTVKTAQSGQDIVIDTVKDGVYCINFCPRDIQFL